MNLSNKKISIRSCWRKSKVKEEAMEKTTVKQIHERLTKGEPTSAPTHIFDRGTGRIHRVEVHRHLQAVRKEAEEFRWKKRFEAIQPKPQAKK
jgi:hypothetical protein